MRGIAAAVCSFLFIGVLSVDAASKLEECRNVQSRARRHLAAIRAAPSKYRNAAETIRYLEKAERDAAACVKELAPPVPPPSAPAAKSKARPRPSASKAKSPAKPTAGKPASDRGPAPRDFARLQKNLDVRGVSKAAAVQSQRLLKRMLSDIDPVVAKRMADAGVRIVIVPKGKKLTDVDGLKHLRGKRTRDGRVWDSVQGVADVDDGKGGRITAMREKHLLPGTGYSDESFLFYHEVAHAVKGSGLSKKDFGEVDRLYRASKKHGSGLGPYAGVSAQEYFAQGSAAYFGSSYEKATPKNLPKAEPELYKLMKRIYGKPRGKK